MNGPYGSLDRIGMALRAGDRDAILSCLAADSTVFVMSGKDQLTFTSSGLEEAVDALLTGFNDLMLTPTSRLVSDERVVEEAVLSGDHEGIFAGAEPTSRRVHVNVRLSATLARDSTLQSLRVEADTQALFAQMTGADDVDGVFGGLVATVRERHDGKPRKSDETDPAWFRRRWVVTIAAALLMVAGVLTWLGTSDDGTPKAQAAPPGKPATVASTTPPPTRPTPSTRILPKPKPGPPHSALPRIAPAAPNAVLHVQRGQQVVLDSDVLFAVDSAALTPTATAALTRIARQIGNNHVTGTIQVNGYTDNLGGRDYDLALSRARAVAVARVMQRALVGRQVTLVPQGFGQSKPVAPNNKAAGQARNRRVTIVLPSPR